MIGALGIASHAGQAGAWQTNLSSFPPNAIALAGNEDLIAAGGGGFVIARLSGATGDEIWRTSLSPAGEALSVTVDGNGDIVAAGLTRSRSEERFSVGKVLGDGTPLWLAQLAGSGSPIFPSSVAYAVTVDGADDVVAAGAIYNESGSEDFSVIKLAGETGEVLWRMEIDGEAGSYDRALAVAVLGDGDVVAVGAVRYHGNQSDLTVVRVSGATGDLVWRQDLRGSGAYGYGKAVVVDENGDVVVAGILNGSDFDFAVVKLAGGDGSERWRSVIDGTMTRDWDQALTVALDPAGDVVAGGMLFNTGTDADFAVVKLAGLDGQELWRNLIDGSEVAELNNDRNGYDRAEGIAVDGTGDVLVTGKLVDADTSEDLVVRKLSGVDGSLLWENSLDGSAGTGPDSDGRPFGRDRGIDVRVGATGDVFVVGSLAQVCGTDGVFFRLDGSDGSGVVAPLDECLLEGRRITLRDKAGRPDRRRLVLTTTPDRSFRMPPFGSQADPTIHGAVLEIVNPITGEAAVVPLPTGGWSTKETPLLREYRYFDPTEASGCRKIILRQRRGLKIICRGAQIDFSLDEPAQGTVGVELSLGTDTLRYCLAFGGTILKDQPVTARRGIFRAIDAPQPEKCVAVLP